MRSDLIDVSTNSKELGLSSPLFLSPGLHRKIRRSIQARSMLHSLVHDGMLFLNKRERLEQKPVWAAKFKSPFDGDDLEISYADEEYQGTRRFVWVIQEAR